MFFEVFRLFKFVNKIRCTENYLELHETNDIYENPINEGLIWNLFWYMSSRAILGFFYKIFWDLHNCVIFFHLLPLVYQ